MYGTAEVLGRTLTDKGGVNDRAGEAINYMDAKLVPTYNADNNKLVGYNAFDTKNSSRKLPVMQLDAGDISDFEKGYDTYMSAARIYYMNGEPSEGIKKIGASFDLGAPSGLAKSGLKQEWNNAIHDPVYVSSLLVSWANAGVSTMDAFNYKYHTNMVSNKIHMGSQGKHIVSHNNYIPMKSILSVDANELLKQFHAGNAVILRNPSSYKVIVDFNKPIGIYINIQTYESSITTRGMIITNKHGAHIVPSAPR